MTELQKQAPHPQWFLTTGAKSSVSRTGQVLVVIQKILYSPPTALSILPLLHPFEQKSSLNDWVNIKMYFSPLGSEKDNNTTNYCP